MDDRHGTGSGPGDGRNATRVLLVGEEAVSRLGLRHLLGAEAEFEVAGEARGCDALGEATRLSPGVIVMFAETTQPSSAELVTSFRRAVPNAAIVVLGRETHHAYMGLLLGAGALSYVLVRSAARDLLAAIRAASRGRRYVGPDLGEAFFQVLARQADSGTKVLSRREQEVLGMFAHGYTLKEIASSLNVSPKSIETYRSRTQEKLGLRTRADVIRYALQTGMFNPELGHAS